MRKSLPTLAFVAFTSLSACFSLAQAQAPSYRDPQNIIDEGIALHDKGDYAKAIEVYATVPQSSHLYPLACYETAMSLYYADNTDACLSKLAEAFRLGYDQPEVFVLKSNVLDDLGKTDQAIAILEKADQNFPFNQNILYNLGVCYLNANSPLKAEAVLIRSVRINPFHARTHNALAKSNYMMGRLPQAYLAAHMGIILSPRIGQVAELENYITNKADSIVNPTAYPYTNKKEAERWSRLKHLLQYEAGFGQNSGYNYKPDYMVSRHALYMFNNLDFEAADTSVYNQLYVRALMDLVKQGWFETYLNHMFTNANLKEVTQWLKDNDKKVQSFFDFVRTELNNAKRYGFSASNEKNGIEMQHYGDNDKLYAIGSSKANVEDSENGPWTYVDGNGSIEQRLTFENGKIVGNGLRYYPNGTIEQKLNRKAGNFDGEQKTFYKNGAPEAIYNFKDGLRHGDETHFTASGLTASTYQYADGKLSGPSTNNYFNQSYSRQSVYANDLLNGPITETWENGNLKLKGTLKDGYYDGPYETYYSNGQLESKGEYVTGFYKGQWLFYHPNGKTKIDAQYGDSGKYQGTIKWYNLDGNLEIVEDTYENGHLTGTHTDYYGNGQPSSVLRYKGDKAVSMTSYNAKGEVMFQGDADTDSTIYVKYFYENGSPKSEGSLLKGKMNGLWKRYNAHGIVTNENTYMNDMQHGPQTSYHPNGKILASFQCDSNRIVGQYNHYNSQGKLVNSSQYSTKGLNGISYDYYNDGTLEKTSDYIDGEPAGRTISYTHKGNKTLEIYYKDGRETRSVYYNEKGDTIADADYELGSKAIELKYPNGQLRKRFTVVDNLYNGPMETWYPNGQLRSCSPFVYGKMNGTDTYYSFKGELSSTHQFRYGERDGQSTWYRQGHIDFVNPYVNGVDHGYSIDYHLNGKIYRKMDYRDDAQTGYSEYFAEDGTPMYRLNYEYNLLVGISSPTTNNSWSEETVIDANTQTISARYANGKTSFTAQLKNGQYNGKAIEYSPMGLPFTESNYEDNQLNGTRTRYYANGKVKDKRDYQLGEQHGQMVRFYDNGAKEIEGQFEQGKETGEWKYYDRNGKLTHLIYYFEGEAYYIKKQ